jgi:hypothetical protein
VAQTPLNRQCEPLRSPRPGRSSPRHRGCSPHGHEDRAESKPIDLACACSDSWRGRASMPRVISTRFRDGQVGARVEELRGPHCNVRAGGRITAHAAQARDPGPRIVRHDQELFAGSRLHQRGGQRTSSSRLSGCVFTFPRDGGARRGRGADTRYPARIARRRGDRDPLPGAPQSPTPASRGPRPDSDAERRRATVTSARLVRGALESEAARGRVLILEEVRWKQSPIIIG